MRPQMIAVPKMAPESSATPLAEVVSASAGRIPATGYRELDEQLCGGGWPLGDTIELLSDGNGLGALGLFLPVMAQFSQMDGPEGADEQVFIAPPCAPYAPLLEARDIDARRIRLIQPRSRQSLLWSIEHSLRGGTCRALFAWLGAEDYRYGELHKLQLAAAQTKALTVLFRPRRVASSPTPSPLRLEMIAYRQVRILKQRGGPQGLDVPLSEANDVPGQPQLWELPDHPPTPPATAALGGA